MKTKASNNRWLCLIATHLGNMPQRSVILLPFEQRGWLSHHLVYHLKWGQSAFNYWKDSRGIYNKSWAYKKSMWEKSLWIQLVSN
jgi:hypothetical protein